MGPHGGGVEGEADKAAAEEGAPQGGSAGGGSQKAAEAEGEEGAIARFFGLWSRYFALT